MNIAVIYSTGYPPEEGIGTYVWNLATGLRDRGHEVTLLTRGDGKSHIKNGIRVEEIKFHPAYPFHVHLHNHHITNYIEKHNFDILNVHSPLCLPSKVNIPIVSTIHTPIKASARRTPIRSLGTLAGIVMAYTISTRIEKQLIDSSSSVTAVSPSVLNWLENEYTISGDLLPNAITPSEFVSSSSSDMYLLYVGRLAPRKGVELLIRAIDQISNSRSVHLRIVGKGPLKNDFKRMVRERDIESSVTFEGFVPDERLKILYQNAYSLVLPSMMEGLPTVGLEALASGTPVIATDTIGNRDLVSSESNGLLVERDIDALSQAIVRLYDNPALRDELAAQARTSVVSEFTWETVSKTAEQLFQRQING